MLSSAMMANSPLVRIFEAVTAETTLTEHDIVLYEYSCERTGKWKWSLGTVEQMIFSESHNCSVVMKDWILPSSARTSRLNSYTNTPSAGQPLTPSVDSDGSLQNGVQFTPGSSVTTVPRSSIFAKFKSGIAQFDQPILLSKTDLSQIGQLLRLRRRAADNSVNTQELMAMVQALLRETSQREQFYQNEMRESLSDQFKQLVQLMELQALNRGSYHPHSTYAGTNDDDSLQSFPGSKRTSQRASISTVELLLRDEEGARMAVLKEESYEAMELVMHFFNGSSSTPTRAAPTVSAAEVEEIRFRLRSRQDVHLRAVERLQSGVNMVLEQARGEALPANLQQLIDVVDSAVAMLADDGCEKDVRAGTPIPDDARRDMAQRFAGVRSNASSRAASADRTATRSMSPPVANTTVSAMNPYRSPGGNDLAAKPPTPQGLPLAPITSGSPAPSPSWDSAEHSDASLSEQDLVIAQLRQQLDKERDMRVAAEGRMSQMSLRTDEFDGELSGATPFNETIALQRRMLQQLQVEVVQRMEFLNLLEVQLRAMRRSKHALLNSNRSAVRQPTDDTEELYAQLNRRIAILLTQRAQVLEEVRGRESEIRSMKALLSSAVKLISQESRPGSCRRTSDDLVEPEQRSSQGEVVSGTLE